MHAMAVRVGLRLRSVLALAACSVHAERPLGQMGSWPKRRERRDEKVAQNIICIF